MIGHFHQHSPAAGKGGIERYLQTLAGRSGTRHLIIHADETTGAMEFGVRPRGSRDLPLWLRYILGVFRDRGAIRERLRSANATILEFSRVEYALVSPFFRGFKIFTVHGTGPSKTAIGSWLVHHACAWLLPFCADHVQVIGRDHSGLPTIVRRLLSRRLKHVDAWYDPSFKVRDLPQWPPVRLFYAGRIASQKNPELLIAIVKALAGTRSIKATYFGSDHDKIEAAGAGHIFQNGGALTPPELSAAIAGNHIGILCSAFGEGSPFIVAETLACGRPMLLPPLKTLVETYGSQEGVFFAEDLTVEAYLSAFDRAMAWLADGAQRPYTIHAAIAQQEAGVAIPRMINGWRTLSEKTCRD